MALLALVLPSLVLGQNDDASAPSPRTFLDEHNNLHYDGRLDSGAVAELFSLYEGAASKPRMLVITSTGGNVELGLDVGEWVHANSLDVMVDRGCASSCANYIFTAGRHKYLKPHSILIWHGGAMQSDFVEQSRKNESFSRYWQGWRTREEAFFKTIEVNSAITVYGQDKYSIRDHIRARLAGQPIAGFDYSVEDMAKFGVTDVHLVDGEWDWRAHNDSVYVVRVAVEL